MSGVATHRVRAMAVDVERSQALWMVKVPGTDSIDLTENQLKT
jgi:hypothetical protein